MLAVVAVNFAVVDPVKQRNRTRSPETGQVCRTGTFELAIHADQSRHVPETNSGNMMPKTNDAALDAFMLAKTEIETMLARLAACSADHFGYRPDDVNWGHVGTLDHYRARLREITDMAFREGEHMA